MSQTDTLSRAQKDSLVALLPRINTELKDYDLLKQKSYIQLETIKALQDRSRAQEAISLRKEIKLSNFSTSIITQQTTIYNLQNQLATANKKKFRRGSENWVWRAGAIALITKLLKIW